MKTISYYIILIISLASCRPKEEEKLTKNVSPEESTIYLNFYDNINSIDPNRIRNQTEQFVCGLLFEPLIQSVDTTGSIKSSFISNVVFQDNNYSFKLKNDLSLHGKGIESEWVFEQLRKIWKSKVQTPSAQAFFESIEGYPLSQWYKTNLKDSTKMPSGIRFNGPKRFNIKLRNSDTLFTKKFQNLGIMISDSSIETGLYELKEWQDDIVCRLESKDSTQLDINIRFIKNEDLKVQEFIQGSLDVISYQPSLSKVVEFKTFLENEINNQYSDYQVFKSNSAIYTEAVTSQINDSTLMKWTLKILESRTQERIDRLIQLSTKDSVEFNQVFLTGDMELLSFDYPFSKVSKDQLRPNVPRITISHQAFILDEKGQKTNENNGENVVVLSVEPKYYLVQRNLTGLHDYMSWKDIVVSSKFVSIKTH